MNLTKEHYDYLDLAKGFGIILVVMGHTMFPLHQAIDVFHMPLFFFLSGLTLRQYDNVTIFVVKKINRVLIPYLFFSILLSIVNFFYPLLGGYDGPLWFLHCLFFTLVLGQVLMKLKSIKWFIMGLCIVITYVVNHYDLVLLPFNLDRVLRAIPYLYLGHTFANNDIKRKLLYKSNGIVSLFFSLFCCIYISGLYFMIANGQILDGEGFKNGEPFGKSVGLIYITSIAGIMTTILMSKLFNRIEIVNWLGRNSLVILCIHYPFTLYWNQFVSSTFMYSTGGGKILLGILSPIVIISFCIPFVFLFKKYIPKLTGYESLLKLKYE